MAFYIILAAMTLFTAAIGFAAWRLDRSYQSDVKELRRFAHQYLDNRR
ncbi:hypothetical protein HCU01_24810 [Halomonas cupida]|uniref:Uncharacterized protein n=1 Tax=Halomonas cupida TaxID=44933 RepID=A0A1M7JPH5_9GAMM|nr:hypothetical protein [Halomonas cupida]GEN24532.1 hypothetical protein HCU01_24810 [Halomonas cupida]SHM54805.1 hypothetical protein SAMN05660971_03255 [Halomonas cupida]